MACQRCRGLLVCAIFYDLSIKTNTRYNAMRCINCGYIEDSVVRANRIRMSASTQGTPGGYGQLPSAHAGIPSRSSHRTIEKTDLTTKGTKYTGSLLQTRLKSFTIRPRYLHEADSGDADPRTLLLST